MYGKGLNNCQRWKSGWLLQSEILGDSQKVKIWVTIWKWKEKRN